jgi:hypothetical protein
MAMLFQAEGLQVTDEWIRCRAGTFAIGDIRNAWVTRRQAGQGSRLMTAMLGIGLLLIVVGGAGASGWLAHNWMWLLAAPVLFFVAAGIGLLDPIAIYLEKRHHELWIATDSVAVRVYKANSVEVNKVLRTIQRARERHIEQSEA